MKKDYFQDDSALKKGRKKIYELLYGNIELILPDGKSAGILNKGDLVYRIALKLENGKKMIHYKVIKFNNTKNKNSVFKSERDLFKKHYNEEKSKAEGEEIKTEEKKKNFKVPIILGAGLGIVGYMMGKRFNKNPLYFAIGGVIVGGVFGYILANKKIKK